MPTFPLPLPLLALPLPQPLRVLEAVVKVVLGTAAAAVLRLRAPAVWVSPVGIIVVVVDNDALCTTTAGCAPPAAEDTAEWV